jgi:hypothetical protein
MNDATTTLGPLIMVLVLLVRDFLIVTCVVSGLAYVAVAIRGRSKTESVAKIVAESPVARPSPLKELLKKIVRTRLKIWAVTQFIVAVIGCLAGSQGFLFSRWQAIGLLILGSLFWVFALLVRGKPD